LQVHAIETENFLADKFLDDEMTFQNALKVLDQELCPEEHLLNPDSDYLKTVAQGLFYKVWFEKKKNLNLIPKVPKSN
jgi:xanthine dehydrogenase/oxidase